MTDHARALADALRECASDLEAEIEARRTGELPRRIERDLGSVRRARKVLAAYDAHPAEALKDTRPDCSSFPIVVQSAEAVTRENGELFHAVKELIENAPIGDDDKPYIADCMYAEFERLVATYNRLSTHQQQGVDSELVKRLICVRDRSTPHLTKCDERGKLSLIRHEFINELIAAFSRAPQPDTEMEYRLGAAYQVIGALLDRLGVHDSDKGQRLLDYFAGYKDAPDPLPFDAYALAPQPDTVTEERLREILAEVKAQIAAHAEDAGFSGLVPHGLMTDAGCLMAMKRATALSAKGK